MGMVQSIGAASERVMAALVSSLEIEFGRGATKGLAACFLASEECDFQWDARLSERWLGAYCSADEDEIELDRVAIVGRIDGRWFAATSIIDGDGMSHAMINRRSFDTRHEAEEAFEHAR